MDQQPAEIKAEEAQLRLELDQFLAMLEIEIGKRLVKIQHTCNAQEAGAISDLLAGIQEIRASLKARAWSRTRIGLRIKQLYRDFGWIASVARLLGGPPG